MKKREFTESRKETITQPPLRKHFKITRHWLAIFLAMVVTCNLISVPANALDYPSAYSADHIYVLPHNTTSYIGFTVFRAYKNEKLHLNIYKGESTDSKNMVYSQTKELSAYGESIDVVEFEVSASWEPGSYTMEYYFEFYSLYDWHLAPQIETHSLTVVEPCLSEHTWDKGYTTLEISCAFPGFKRIKCKLCGNYKTEKYQIEHTWDSGKVYIKPDLTQSGLAVYTCQICGETKDWEIAPILSDVVIGSYYEDAVVWAYNSDVTKGTSESTFSPENRCSRGEIITFLYRAAGSPEVEKDNTILDIKPTDFYYNAVVWAKENHMFEENVFNPSRACTRLMAVDFIWKYFGSQEAQGKSGFSDIDKEYEPAVNWAVKQKITSGTGGTSFSPDTVCTRAQICTFLYRAFEVPNLNDNKTNDKSQVDEPTHPKPVKDGFDEESNFVFTLGGIDFSVPNYWTYIDDPDAEEDNCAFYAEFNEDTGDMTFIIFANAEYDKKKYTPSEAIEAFTDNFREEYNIIQESDITQNPNDILIKRVVVQIAEESAVVFYLLSNPNQNAVIMLGFFQSDLAEYEYTSDVQKIIESASVKA